jgi:hypothetical protein
LSNIKVSYQVKRNATAHCEKDSHCEKELCFLKACYVLEYYVLEHCVLVLIEKEKEKQCDSEHCN